MATFTLSNFENESASEFISDVMVNGYGMIGVAIDRVLDPDNKPGLIECEEAIIAAEFIAKAVGNPAHDFPDDASEWCNIYLSKGSVENREVLNYVEKAADAID